MAGAGSYIVAVFTVVVVVQLVQSSRVRRSDVIGYLFDSTEDASIAGDHIGVGADCSDDYSSESIEVAYIINKREVPEDRRGRTLTAAHASPQPNTRPIV